jgi:outer membrane protein
MKRIVLSLAMVVGLVAANAQKIGYISSAELMSIMPEAKKADSMYKQFADVLNQQYQNLGAEVEALSEKLNGIDSVKKAVDYQLTKKELNEKYLRYINFEQSEAQQQLQNKQSELFAPVQKKAFECVQRVAKANQYVYVLNTESIVIAPEGDNLLKLCAADLKIKLPEPKAPAGTPRN